LEDESFVILIAGFEHAFIYLKYQLKALKTSKTTLVLESFCFRFKKNI